MSEVADRRKELFYIVTAELGLDSDYEAWLRAVEHLGKVSQKPIEELTDKELEDKLDVQLHYGAEVNNEELKSMKNDNRYLDGTKRYLTRIKQTANVYLVEFKIRQRLR